MLYLNYLKSYNISLALVNNLSAWRYSKKIGVLFDITVHHVLEIFLIF
jgi:hypothetical protein